MHVIRTGLAIGVAVVGFGCASAPPPTEQLASAEASLRAAREIGAAQVPRAELHLRLAQEQLTKARTLSKDGDNEEAARLMDRAHADAELALALAREATMHRDLEAVTGPRAAAEEAPAITNPNPTVSAVR
jgi:hypothetical protein